MLQTLEPVVIVAPPSSFEILSRSKCNPKTFQKEIVYVKVTENKKKHVETDVKRITKRKQNFNLTTHLHIYRPKRQQNNSFWCNKSV